ncbi:2,5-dihydroxypyridine 5,6-dioxygenase [Cupriavidus sp. ISTL7]|nr:2,5-dihydroxypyridine 5,6-dioxygenase [Cupriavidus sp. ISTL7]
MTASRQTPTTAQGALWGITPLTGHRSGVEILKRADILIDLIGLLHSPEQLDIQKAGTRVLMVVEPPDILARMLAREDTRPRVEAAGRKIAAASTLRITSPAGTDLTYRLGQYSHSPILQYGYTDQPAGGTIFQARSPIPGRTRGERGRHRVARGDIIYPFKEFVRGNVRITVRNGFITDIEGGFDAEHLAHFLAAWNDPDAYAMAHIGWGLDEMALWNGISLINKETAIGQDGRAFYGNVLWSTGPNTDVGGTRNTPAHLDIVMKGASLYLDGEPMVLDGDVIPADQRVPSPGAR